MVQLCKKAQPGSKNTTICFWIWFYTKYMFGFHGYSFTGQLVTKWLLVGTGALVVMVVFPTCRLWPSIALVAVCEDRLCLGWCKRAEGDNPVPRGNRLELPATGLTGTGTWTMDSDLKIHNQTESMRVIIRNKQPLSYSNHHVICQRESGTCTRNTPVLKGLIADLLAVWLHFYENIIFPPPIDTNNTSGVKLGFKSREYDSGISFWCRQIPLIVLYVNLLLPDLITGRSFVILGRFFSHFSPLVWSLVFYITIRTKQVIAVNAWKTVSTFNKIYPRINFQP